MSIEFNIGIAIAIAISIGIPAFIVWRSRPTKTDLAVWELGFNDGAEGRTPEKWDHPHNARTYLEAYEDGSRGRTRRADAEKIRNRQKRTEGGTK